MTELHASHGTMSGFAHLLNLAFVLMKSYTTQIIKKKKVLINQYPNKMKIHTSRQTRTETHTHTIVEGGDVNGN